MLWAKLITGLLRSILPQYVCTDDWPWLQLVEDVRLICSCSYSTRVPSLSVFLILNQASDVRSMKHFRQIRLVQTIRFFCLPFLRRFELPKIIREFCPPSPQLEVNESKSKIFRKLVLVYKDEVKKFFFCPHKSCPHACPQKYYMQSYLCYYTFK